MDTKIAYDFSILTEGFGKKGWELRVSEEAFTLQEFRTVGVHTYTTIKELKAAYDMLEHAAQSYPKNWEAPDES